jgi:hypothetical protein
VEEGVEEEEYSLLMVEVAVEVEAYLSLITFVKT